MPTCEEPRCDQPAAWTCRDGRPRCTPHAIDRSPLTAIPVPPRPADPPPADEGILAAVCPPGWRRSPLDGRPVMPCLGKLLFPCRPSEVPTPAECHAQCAVCVFDPIVEWLVLAVLMNAIDDKTRHNHCMHLYDEGAVSAAVDAALFAQGIVRIRKTAAGGWEEVGGDAAEK